MTTKTRAAAICFSLALAAVCPACGRSAKPNPAEGAPPPPVVQRARSADDPFSVDDPGRFPVVSAVTHVTPPALTVSGTIIDNNLPAPQIRMTSLMSQTAGSDMGTADDEIDFRRHGHSVLQDGQAARIISGAVLPNGSGELTASSSQPPHLWVVCDVYQTDLSFVTLGHIAEVRAEAYPKIVSKALISNIVP
ncbi:MAG TPA: hypothetical protein VI756_07240, partial [Blastocatellia bacterium]